MNDTKKDQISSILHQWMQEANINNYQELRDLTKVSERQFYRLENGLLDNIPLGILLKIAQGLNISLNTLLEGLSSESESSPPRTQKRDDSSQMKQEFEREAITILESLLLQLPTLAYVVTKNPNLSASKILPLLAPLDQLLSHWQLEMIGQVGEVVPYNPQEHELMNGEPEAIEQVQIRYAGYRHHDQLLYRARVSPLEE